MLRAELTGVAESPMVQIATIAEAMPGSLKLCYGESDLPTPAFICEALDRAAKGGHTFYTHTAGYRELREAIGGKVFDLHGVRYDVPELMATVGGTMAIYAAIRAHVGRGDNAVIISPAYAIYTNSVTMSGGESRRVPLTLSGDRFVLDLDRVRGQIDANTRMLIVNSPSNPTGWIISEAEQRALIEIAERHGLVILADEVYERLIYSRSESGSGTDPDRGSESGSGTDPDRGSGSGSGTKTDRDVAPSFARMIGDRERLVVVNSFSKTYNMTGWRLGWAQSGERVIKTMYKAVEFMTSNPAAMVQQAGITALRDGEPHIADLRAHYAARRDQVKAALEELPGVTLPDPQGSFFAFPRCDFAADSTAFTAELVRKTGVALAPGVGFGPDGEGYIRVCFASTEATIADAMSRLQKFVTETRA